MVVLAYLWRKRKGLAASGDRHVVRAMAKLPFKFRQVRPEKIPS